MASIDPIEKTNFSRCIGAENNRERPQLGIEAVNRCTPADSNLFGHKIILSEILHNFKRKKRKTVIKKVIIRRVSSRPPLSALPLDFPPSATEKNHQPLYLPHIISYNKKVHRHHRGQYIVKETLTHLGADPGGQEKTNGNARESWLTYESGRMAHDGLLGERVLKKNEIRGPGRLRRIKKEVNARAP